MVKRYDLISMNAYPEAGFENVIEEVHGGDFVRYEDYEEVSDKLADCQAQAKWLQDKIAALLGGE